MIEYVAVQNFQAHRKLKIEFDPRITTIVGPSDVGKSAIIRALRWAITNTPSGDSFKSTGTKGTTVTVGVDGHTVRRKKGGSTNSYEVDGDASVSFGRGVPGPVASVFNMAAVCWQGQHDAPFWFGQTGGDVAKRLNAVVNLGVIDTTLAHMLADNHAARVRLKDATEAFTKADLVLEGLEWVPAMAQVWAGVVANKQAATELEARVDRLRTLLVAAKEAKERVLRFRAFATSAEKLQKAALGHIACWCRWENLRAHLQVISEAKQGTNIVVADTKPIVAAWRAYSSKADKVASLTKLVSQSLFAEEQVEEHQRIYDKNKEQLKQCPTCKRFL